MSKSRRLDLHFILCDILGSKYAYFQPPESVKLKYPCFIYKLSNIDTKYADNRAYSNRKRYDITYIDKDPDSATHEKLLELPYCSFDRFFTSDNMNHWMYTLYF